MSNEALRSQANHTLTLVGQQNPTSEHIKALHDGALTDLVQAIMNGTLPPRDRVREFYGLAPLKTEAAENIFGCVRLISGAETLTLEPTDGTETIAQAVDVFTAGIDREFENWGLDVPSKPTGRQNVQVYEMVKDGTSADVFGGLGGNMDTLCLTQAQIIQFVRKHRKRLHADGYVTLLIPFKAGVVDAVLVSRVRLYTGGRPGACVRWFSDDLVWRAEFRPRFVVPCLPAGRQAQRT